MAASWVAITFRTMAQAWIAASWLNTWKRMAFAVESMCTLAMERENR
jgi:hypothetical protein